MRGRLRRDGWSRDGSKRSSQSAGERERSGSAWLSEREASARNACVRGYVTKEVFFRREVGARSAWLVLTLRYNRSGVSWRIPRDTLDSSNRYR